jgi:GNAT superfamily N-acetyltransferase
VIFEPAMIEDAAALAEIHALAFRESWSPGEIAAMIRGAGAFGFVARKDGEITGFVLCRTIADEAEVLTLATAPAHRRGGVARGLVATAVTRGGAGRRQALPRGRGGQSRRDRPLSRPRVRAGRSARGLLFQARRRDRGARHAA